MAIVGRYSKYDEAGADAHAAQVGGYVKYNPRGVHTFPNGSGGQFTSIGIYEVHTRSAPSGGGGRGSASPAPPVVGGGRQQAPVPAGPQAGAATQSAKALTGGGIGFKQGRIEEGLVATRLDDEYMGLDTLTAPEKVAPGYSPDAPGFDQAAKLGSRCKRHGVAKMTMDRDSVTLSSSAIGAGYRGLSLGVMPSSGNLPDQMVLAFADNSIGSTRSSLQTALLLVTNNIRWGRPVNLRGWPGPKITLSQQTGPLLRVTVDYTNVFDATTQAGMRANSVVQIVIRYSTTGFPRDIDGQDEDRVTAGFTSIALADRTAWTGASANYDTGVLALGKYYVTVWAISREGVSNPSFATETLT